MSNKQILNYTFIRVYFNQIKTRINVHPHMKFQHCHIIRSAEGRQLKYKEKQENNKAWQQQPQFAETKYVGCDRDKN